MLNVWILEGSPFYLSLSDRLESGMHSHHLKRKVIFLFLDCTFTLISQNGNSADSFICSGVNSDLELIFALPISNNMEHKDLFDNEQANCYLNKAKP